MAWLCKYMKSLLQGNEKLSVKSALFSASGSASVFMFSDNSSPLLSAQSPQTQLLRSIFWWRLCLKSARPHSGFLKCCRAVFQSVYAHYFSFSWLRISRAANRGVCTAGITFPLPRMKQFDSISGFDTLTFASPRPAGGRHARRNARVPPRSVCLRNHIFGPGDSCLPRERAERGANENMFSSAYSCVAVSANQYLFPCKSLRLRLISQAQDLKCT